MRRSTAATAARTPSPSRFIWSGSPGRWDVLTSDRWVHRRKKASGAILAEFASLDALLENDAEEKRRKQQHERKLQLLRAEADAADTDGGDSSALGKLVHDMETNMSSLAADSELFAVAELPVVEEQFGYVFMPITEVSRVGLKRVTLGLYANVCVI